MSTGNEKRLEGRVARAAEEALAEHGFVSPIDVLCGLGWLHPSNVERWRRGRPQRLEDVVFIEPFKIETTIRLLGAWARERGLEPSDRPYPARSRTARELRFSASGDPELERAYKTHWLSPQFSEAERAQLDRRDGRRPELVVIRPLGEFTCSVCGAQGSGLLMMEDPGPVCMACAEMDHLLFLASGDAALTRRARAASGLSAVVVRFSRAHKRYERQGILVEEEALESAEAECLADEQVRARRREREALRRAEHDRDLQQRIADEIRRLFPGCPPERAQAIAGHTAARGSGRVGRSAAGRALESDALELAVIASVRHRDTRYDELLMSGVDRHAARAQVADEVASMLRAWRSARLTPHARAPAAQRS
ncbi:MAG TPA: DUF2293 domain-containing protein [Solirubrobacteraceae bacterium]|nr:DUF2293 domain-containing protein [Solirubrobacteraceae bacterium]